MSDDVSADLQDTPLIDRHRRLGAKLAGFAGWRLPMQFTGTLAEHEAVRSDVGIFDVSHLGTVWITGPEATAVIADTLTNDPWRLEDGASQYTLFCDDKGGILDDLIVIRLDGERWMAMPNAANAATVVAGIEAAAARRRAAVEDASASWAVLALQGPRALAVAAGLVELDPSALAFTRVGVDRRGDHEVLVSRTGYTGEPGVELVLPGDAAGPVWDAALEAGAVPCGLGARDTLRLEMGYPLHGNDLGPEVTPFEARLGFAVRLEREGRPPGADALEEARARGPERRLWGLAGRSRRAPRSGMTVLRDGAEVGVVTSGSFSPVRGVGIGMGLLATGVEPGDEVEVDVRGRGEPFEVLRPPFVERDPRG